MEYTLNRPLSGHLTICTTQNCQFSDYYNKDDTTNNDNKHTFITLTDSNNNQTKFVQCRKSISNESSPTSRFSDTDLSSIIMNHNGKLRYHLRGSDSCDDDDDDDDDEDIDIDKNNNPKISRISSLPNYTFTKHSIAGSPCPCPRHHHRRNSTAVKFDKPSYK
ncbi:hypothetical protein Kpol_1018p9 [Vanderwaltozyma polyspora DSM 70294]|uniref:Uncharacterized protein n=1 Tax=Vanderwaltozyma polyspora (strain ATCC 22028 / DSM 70294 / BCRC 21397 / CBS 2163 / NBRC 10782 / NRRL Y-8283 / UCD 57-17) TaxID=436907 RepID=A7TDL2_VANPO|nr:uncharacterized protein Kpol_1018p9 [Vanderwaltozyma polyspora DSM 70294]EDO19482.1 hypothetical protein Kpol_1018p9 [Vanderwaltozyma polyspora DSM 70294]